MTYETNCTLPVELLEQIITGGLDVVPELICTGERGREGTRIPAEHSSAPHRPSLDVNSQSQ